MPGSHFNFESHPTATSFLAKMREKLEANEARNGLILGLALRVENDPHAYGDADPYFATVENGIGVVTAALMTPPHGVVLFCVNDDIGPYETDALRAIAHNLYADSWVLPTVHGESATATKFADIWCELTGATYEVDTNLRAFKLSEVDHPTYSAGHLRQVTPDDYHLAAQWIREFDREAMGEEAEEERIQKRLNQKIADGHFYFWEDEKPVSLAGITRPTARGISIGPVYTPPAYRGCGYASSAVARLSQDMLDSGKEYCALFTDLANPTSNSIYQKIGYKPVGDFTLYRFLMSRE